MNFALAYNYIIATVLIVICLALPTTIFAHAATLEKAASGVQTLSGMAATAPCDDCPCSDGQGSDCCDTCFCSCACHAPLSHGLRLIYAPEIVSQSFREPSWSLPTVYRSIFVPPQNHA